jgi:hypothetical protein
VESGGIGLSAKAKSPKAAKLLGDFHARTPIRKSAI